MPAQVHILVVDDDPRIRSMLRRYLTGEGFLVSDVENGLAMREILDARPVDLVLLDLVMPGDDGFTLARHIRQGGNTPIIMLTGKGELVDKVAGLEAGADDYIAKPFHLREVLARIRTVLRRAQPAESGPSSATSAGASPTAQDPQVLAFDGWRLDLAKRELQGPDGEPVALTTGEFDLLKALALNSNRVLNRDTLMDIIKGREWAAYDRSIDAQVVRLRKKIERDPGNPRLIKTVRGVGYLFTGSVVVAG